MCEVLQKLLTFENAQHFLLFLQECTNLKELSLSNSVVTSCKSIAQLLADTDDETDDEWPTTLCSHSLEVLHLDGQVSYSSYLVVSVPLILLPPHEVVPDFPINCLL